ncbi:MAG: hypothetical protein U0V72_14975 [Cytophagales bacterium]
MKKVFTKLSLLVCATVAQAQNTTDCKKELVLQPYDGAGKDAEIHSRKDLVSSNRGTVKEFDAYAWTWNADGLVLEDLLLSLIYV